MMRWNNKELENERRNNEKLEKAINDTKEGIKILLENGVALNDNLRSIVKDLMNFLEGYLDRDNNKIDNHFGIAIPLIIRLLA